MLELKRNCASEAHISCPKCEKRGRSRVIKAHMTAAHGAEADYSCVLPKSDGTLCEWSCGMKISCFNSHQRIMHGISFADGAKHIYTTTTGFVLKDATTLGVKGHTAMCIAGSKAQSKLVMEEGRARYRLHRDLVGLEVVDFQNIEKVAIGGRWYMPGGLREIVLRQDGTYVCELAGKRKRMSKPTTPSKRIRVHEENTHTVSAVAPSNVIFEGDVSSLIEHVAVVDVPVILVDEQALAEVTNEEENIPTEVVIEEENIHAGLVNEDLVTEDCDDDSEEEFVDYDYDADVDDEENDADNSIIEVEVIEDVEVSSAEPVVGNFEEEEDNLQNAFVESGHLDDLSDDSESELVADVTDESEDELVEEQEVLPAAPVVVEPVRVPGEVDIEEQGRGTDDTDFRFAKLVASFKERGQGLDWGTEWMGIAYGKTLDPGVGGAIALKAMEHLTQIPDAEHAMLLMRWKIKQLAKQREAWKHVINID